ncbi:hypothetical protein [Citricoccus muralis]|uniref:Uncharacterized protein n=1 Tax=Citricoccus muralis TaxID=169134 RepID=A0ABY8H676_9MICC|nr:hypothetical protein [Citricoccus muralis]WFP16639.1 hypothetical protein P8192_00490 [Citricoccus muralis]
MLSSKRFTPSLADVGGYHSALTAYRTGDVDSIVRAFADASVRAVHNARALANDVEQLRAGWDERLTARKAPMRGNFSMRSLVDQSSPVSSQPLNSMYSNPMSTRL